jgi:Cu/Ag efflux protein CusF
MANRGHAPIFVRETEIQSRGGMTMRKTIGLNERLFVGCGGVTVLALALAAWPASAADLPAHRTTTTTEQGGGTTTTAETTHATVAVAAIDKNARKLTVKGADGEKTDIQVPADVKEFDKLKVGDKIDIDYMESIAISMAPKGTKPNAMERVATVPGAVGREVTATAEIIKVDPAANKVTLKGPGGKHTTVTVQDPGLQAKLPSLKKGQVVMFQYTEAVATAIQPSSK